MEAYRTKCRSPECAFERTWIGYKTGIGKTPEQLAQMHKEQTTCIKCGGLADTHLDERGLVGAMDARNDEIAQAKMDYIDGKISMEARDDIISGIAFR